MSRTSASGWLRNVVLWTRREAWPGALISRDGTCKEDQRETNRQDSSDAVGTSPIEG